MDSSSRRDFLKTAGTISACMCCMGAISFLESCAGAKKAGATNVSFTETADLVSIPKASFTKQKMAIIKTKKFDEPLFVAQQNDGSYLALRMQCTHKGCAVNETPAKFVCPCHGSEFSLKGEVLTGPAKEPLPSFIVTTDEMAVLVHFS